MDNFQPSNFGGLGLKVRVWVRVMARVNVSHLSEYGLWYYSGAAAQWLEPATDDRVVAGSNPTEAAWKQSAPHFASVFRKRH